jgi:membrane-associated phospholipid phosphatase
MTALRQFLLTRRQLAGLLVAVFVANYLETQWEEAFKNPATHALGERFSQAFLEMEGGFHFGSAEQAGPWMVVGYSFSYFALFPLMLLGSVAACWRRESTGALRIFSVAVAVNYLMALPFFVFMPVPERWAFPGAKATLLSDLISSKLIEVVRPISGLDNCFPSMHAALSVLVILLAYWCRSRWRHCVACLGATIILSTFFLGVHWIPDIVMGAACAGLSFAAAVGLNHRLFPQEAHRAPRRRMHPRLSPATTSPFLRPATAKLVFISYRREGGSRLARVVQMELERRGFPCFLDVDDLGAEHFDDRLLLEIERAPNCVVVLAPGSLDRCHRPDDWMRREIVHALAKGRNVVPLMADDFRFPKEEELVEELRNLPRLNGVSYSHEYFMAAFDKLAGFLKRK